MEKKSNKTIYILSRVFLVISFSMLMFNGLSDKIPVKQNLFHLIVFMISFAGYYLTKEKGKNGFNLGFGLYTLLFSFIPFAIYATVYLFGGILNLMFPDQTLRLTFLQKIGGILSFLVYKPYFILSIVLAIYFLGSYKKGLKENKNNKTEIVQTPQTVEPVQEVKLKETASSEEKNEEELEQKDNV